MSSLSPGTLDSSDTCIDEDKRTSSLFEIELQRVKDSPLHKRLASISTVENKERSEGCQQ